jgi:hypothetical protein
VGVGFSTATIRRRECIFCVELRVGLSTGVSAETFPIGAKTPAFGAELNWRVADAACADSDERTMKRISIVILFHADDPGR